MKKYDFDKPLFPASSSRVHIYEYKWIESENKTTTFIASIFRPKHIHHTTLLTYSHVVLHLQDGYVDAAPGSLACTSRGARHSET